MKFSLWRGALRGLPVIAGLALIMAACVPSSGPRDYQTGTACTPGGPGVIQFKAHGNTGKLVITGEADSSLTFSCVIVPVTPTTSSTTTTTSSTTSTTSTTLDPNDLDGDGYVPPADCDETNPDINPGVTDIPNNGIDENCDGHDLIVLSGAVRVTLTWDTDDDLDLHVVEPSSEEIWYRHRASATGGILDRDDNVGHCGADAEAGGVENIAWETDPPTGGYAARVVDYNDCDANVTANYTLSVFVDDVLAHTETGTLNITGGESTPLPFSI